MQPIQIIGAGIGGLSAAVALARKGFAVSVHERAAQLREAGAGIQLGPNAFRAFEHLGLHQAMERIAFAPPALVLMDSPTGEEICRQELGLPFLTRFGHPYRVGYRADVQKVLLDAVREYGDRITLHLGSEIRAFSQEDDGVLLTGPQGQRVPGAAVIGADGLWSAMRSSLLQDGQPRTPGHVAYRAVLPIAKAPPGLLSDTVQVWVGPEHHLVCYKLRSGTLFNIVAIFHSNRYQQGWDNSADPEELFCAFATACPRVQQFLRLVETWRMWVLCDRDPTPGWSVGHATLLGDAAHPTLPYLAQGACMAIEDAVCLANCLEQTDDIAAGLQDYEHMRLPRTAQVQRLSRQMGVINHASGAARESRNKNLAARDPRDYESNAWLFEWQPSVLPAQTTAQSFWAPAKSPH
jgi:2-polyprenyl-6-methoxyphenol hydroxylase-like FAD-dependent oxidoreductase